MTGKKELIKEKPRSWRFITTRTPENRSRKRKRYRCEEEIH